MSAATRGQLIYRGQVASGRIGYPAQEQVEVLVLHRVGHLVTVMPVPLSWSNIVVDCRDPERVGRFWSQALDLKLNGPEEGEWWLEPGGDRPDILFLQVPEEKAVKNRVHMDLRPEDQHAEVERLLGLGARRVNIGQREVSWVVMADPEGNEFCVLRPLPAPEEEVSGPPI